MGFRPELLVGVVIFVILLAAFVPVISENIANADDQRLCTNADYPNECLDLDTGVLNWCSNETQGTLRCTNATLPVYNSTYELCTNNSGVGVINGTPTSVCDSIGWADGIVAYEDVGLSATEAVLLGLVILLLVIGGVIGFINGSGLTKNK